MSFFMREDIRMLASSDRDNLPPIGFDDIVDETMALNPSSSIHLRDVVRQGGSRPMDGRFTVDSSIRPLLPRRAGLPFLRTPRLVGSFFSRWDHGFSTAGFYMPWAALGDVFKIWLEQYAAENAASARGGVFRREPGLMLNLAEELQEEYHKPGAQHPSEALAMLVLCTRYYARVTDSFAGFMGNDVDMDAEVLLAMGHFAYGIMYDEDIELTPRAPYEFRW